MREGDWGLAISVLGLCAVSFFIGTLTIMETVTYASGMNARNKIYKCEKSIPRNRHCVIVAKETEK